MKEGDVISCLFEFEPGLTGEAWVCIGDKSDTISDDEIFYYAQPEEMKIGNVLGDAKLVAIGDKVNE